MTADYHDKLHILNYLLIYNDQLGRGKVWLHIMQILLICWFCLCYKWCLGKIIVFNVYDIEQEAV